MKNNFNLLEFKFSRDAKALPYVLNALSPIISMEKICALHGNNRQTYIANMNQVLLQAEDALEAKNEERIE